MLIGLQRKISTIIVETFLYKLMSNKEIFRCIDIILIN
jgi:hypothetical protein